MSNRKCLNCKNELFTFRSVYCSKSCKEKFRRKRLKNKNKIKYKNQIVISINGLTKNDDTFYYIVDLKRDKRDHRLVNKNDCTLVLKDSGNTYPDYILEYDYNKSKRISCNHSLKKLFWVTEDGLLISRRSRKICSQYLNDNGYLQHSTRVAGRESKCINIRIHRLIAEAFVINDDIINKVFVNHLDGIKTNNYYKNLEWTTPKGNTVHAIENGLFPTGSDCKHSLFTKEEIDKIRKLKSLNHSYGDLMKIFNKGTKSSYSSICLYKTYK